MNETQGNVSVKTIIVVALNYVFAVFLKTS